MKYILIIGDGMADNPVEALGGKTPLEYASKPFIDEMASKGVLGSVRNVPEGLPAGSDTAITAILGCDPRIYYTGRAPLEVAASGHLLAAGSAAYRCNMIALEDCDKPIEEKKIISHSAGSIEGDDSDALITWLFENPEFKPLAEQYGVKVFPCSNFRHMAEQKDADLDGIVLIPPHDHLGETCGQYLPSGSENAAHLKEMMLKAHELLDHHPINERRRAEGKLPGNGIWFWAEGTVVSLPNFGERYHKTGAVISAVPLCFGIAALTGLDQIHVEGATGEIDTNLEGKVDAAVDAVQKYDFVCLHIEAPDECTHNGDLAGKVQAIEWLDSRVSRPLTERIAALGIDYRLLMLSDHKTLTGTRGHDGDPVPFFIYDSRTENGSGLAYTEANGLRGPMIPDGTMLLPMLFAE